MARKPGLGKGLDALIPSTPSQKQSENRPGAVEINIKTIIPNPHQPRKEMKAEELQDLTDSIREHGIIQPLIVQPINADGVHILIAGERRFRAAQKLGLITVPVIERKVTEQEQLEIALIENVQRSDLSALDTAHAYQQLVDEFSLTQEEIAKRVGKNRVTITNTLRLLRLPEAVQAALAENLISEGHARAMLQLPSIQSQLAVLETIIRLGYSVRQTEELVRQYGGEKKQKPIKKMPSPEIQDIENQLEARIGMPVKLQHSGKQGKLVITYYNTEDLNTLIERFLGE
ncbi:MAG: stage 0 sporulation protein J [Anaerolineaceae bacterium]|nr:stage 0 sporulation protein J [Anaerolineaceae bacterium]